MENYNYVFGFLTWQLFIAMLAFAFIGVGISLLLHAQKRDQNSQRTPREFKFWFLIKDNWKPITLTIILILITIRFGPHVRPDMFKPEELSTPLGTDKWLLGSLIVGIGYNQLMQLWKDKTEWLKVK